MSGPRSSSNSSPIRTPPSSVHTSADQPMQMAQQQQDRPSASDATSKLADAIDDFLGDLEKKFKGISDEILTRLDDMAERCDRLEQEILLRDAAALETVSIKSGTVGGGQREEN